MNLFRFCRQGLTALPVFFMLISCDKLLPTGGNGELVPVKIRSVSVKGYGEASATRSAGGEKRIVGQPVIQDLGGGMFAEITVEEDVSALRAGNTPLEEGVLFRVIAVNSDDDTVYSYADYEVPSTAPAGGGITPYAGNLHVLSGGSYYFVCISYNSKTALPTPSPTPGDNLSTTTIAVTTTNDLLWQVKLAPTNSASIDLTFDDLKHQFAQVKVTLDCTYNDWPITEVASNSIYLSLSGYYLTNGTFNLATGDLISNSDNNRYAYFGGWKAVAGTSDRIWESDLLKIIPATVTAFRIKQNAVTLGSGALQPVTKVPALGMAILDNTSSFQLSAPPRLDTKGHSYTIGIKLRMPKFASSNIYWDGTKLTFKPYSDDPDTEYAANEEYRYMGVFFRWGSLVGVCPARKGNGTSDTDTFGSGISTDVSTGTPIYVPTYNRSNPVASTWEQTNTSARFSAPDNSTQTTAADVIPSIATIVSNGYLFGLGDSEFEALKGDICRYISTTEGTPDYYDAANNRPLYRMPRYKDFKGSTYTYRYDEENCPWVVETTLRCDWGRMELPSSADNNAGRYKETEAGARFGPTRVFFPGRGGRRTPSLYSTALFYQLDAKNSTTTTSSSHIKCQFAGLASYTSVDFAGAIRCVVD